MRFEKLSHSEASSLLYSIGLFTDSHDVISKLKLPKRSTKNSAGYDFFSPISMKFKKGDTVKIPLLVRVEDMPSNAVLLLFNRSGLSLKKGLRLDNAVGVIDADYKECIWMQATATKDIEIKEGDKVCQGVFVNFITTDDDDADGERNGGFGSTGR